MHNVRSSGSVHGIARLGDVRILVLFYTVNVNFTTYSSKVDYTYTCTKTRHNTLKTKFEGKKGFGCEGNKFLTFTLFISYWL